MTDIADMTTESVASMTPEAAHGAINDLKSNADFRSQMTRGNPFNDNSSRQAVWDQLHVRASGGDVKQHVNNQQPPRATDNRAHDDRVPPGPDGYHFDMNNYPHLSETIGNEREAIVAGDKQLRGWAHSLGMSSQDLNGVMRVLDFEFGNRFDQGRAQAMADKAEQRIRAEWGPDAEDRMRQVNRFLRERGGKDFMEFLNASNLANSDWVMRKFDELAKKAGY